jgi:Do/DeqQ family serine protease
MLNLKKSASIFAIAIAGGLAALTGEHYYYEKEATIASERMLRNPTPVKLASYKGVLPENNPDFVTTAQKAVPAVVYIESKVQFESERHYNSIWDFFYGPQQPNIVQGEVSGSGVIVSSDGYIVTNNHVVDEAGKIHVILNDKRTYTARVIGKDPATDLALLKINADNLPYMEYGNSDELQVGQWVLAIGNPYNLTSTVTAGIVSAKGRNIDILPQNEAHKIYPIESYIQTDAAVNPGNSGGALVNTNGQLVGINSAIASTTGSYSGYSFAIPVNLVRKVVADILQYGNVQRAFLGVDITNMNEEIAKHTGADISHGVYIDSVLPNGAAEKAGINTGDIIIRIGDQPVNNVAELEEQIGNYRPGDKISVTVLQNNKEVTKEVILLDIDGTTYVGKTKPDNKTSESAYVEKLGASFSPVTKDELNRLNIVNGVKVAALNNGLLANAGVRKGFIITKLDHKKVNSVDDIQSILADENNAGVLVEGIYPDGSRAYYAFGI